MDDSLAPDLNLFEGMDGFEKFNPMDDSSLTAILDDLEEGTLLSLLGDESLLNDMTGTVISENCLDFSDFPVMDIPSDSREQPQCIALNNDSHSVECSQTNSSIPSIVPPHSDKTETDFTKKTNSKRPLQEPPQVNSKALKRARLDSSVFSADHLLSCVHHDHSYTAPQRCSSSESVGGVSKDLRSPVGSSSDEEGSVSDAGYDTMSSSTSPGNGAATRVRSSPPSNTQQSGDGSTVLPPPSKVDPVALIDARIQHFMCSREVNLTEEEKETLKAEGLPIPTTLPLTKAEEKALRGVRRRIRNKVAAQESRKRKKEHLSLLEDKCKQYCSENHQLKKKMETLENENKTFRAEINKLKEMLGTQGGNTSKTTRVGACLMVMVLCFAIFFGSITPHSLWSRPADYTTSSVRSRSLLSMEDSPTFKAQATNWFREIFMLKQFTESDERPLPPDHPLLHGPLSYYEHVYSQVSGYLNFTTFREACSATEETETNNATTTTDVE